MRNASDHLKKFNEIGGISFNPAILPTMKFPDQNNVARKSRKDAIIILLFFSITILEYYKRKFLTKS